MVTKQRERGRREKREGEERDSDREESRVEGERECMMETKRCNFMCVIGIVIF